jgi:hypothetical protein
VATVWRGVAGMPNARFRFGRDVEDVGHPIVDGVDERGKCITLKSCA